MLPPIEIFRRSDMEEYRRRPYYDPASLVSKIVAMCRTAGVSINDSDFLTFRHTRLIRGRRGWHRGRGRILEADFYAMYEGLRIGRVLPQLFRQVLAKRGWQAAGYPVLRNETPRRRAQQIRLGMV
ncbi:MAG: hypothetical protein HY421_02050 [Candidatus Kerfeldbacteria bacterium]|nr:hypothetical protein [Candidatus Kerfeldbacteria bacterium]